MESTRREYNSPQKKNFGVGILPDRYFHLYHRNETRTWTSLDPRNLPIKFGTNPSTIFLVIVVTDTHTDRQTDKQTHKPTPVNTYSLANIE